MENKTKKIRLMKPYIFYEEIEKEFINIFKSGIFTKGKYVAQLSEKLKKEFNCSYAYLTTSATTALSISLEVIGVKKKDLVAVSDFSWPASSYVISNIGAIPVFIDVNQDTYNMKYENIEKVLNNKKIKAVIFVHSLGNPSGILEIKSLCNQKNIPLIEDAACAFGSRINGVKVGTISDITCFSFHPRKLISSGEGGAILTSNSTYGNNLKNLLSQGISSYNEMWQNFTHPGYNFRLTEIQAVMILNQMDKISYIVKQRTNIREKYSKRLVPLKFVPQKIDDNALSNFQSISFRVPSYIIRDNLIKKLRDKQVESTLGTFCLSATSFNKLRFNTKNPNSLNLQNRTISLPCYEGIDVEYVCDLIEEILNEEKNTT